MIVQQRGRTDFTAERGQTQRFQGPPQWPQRPTAATSAAIQGCLSSFLAPAAGLSNFSNFSAPTTRASRFSAPNRTSAFPAALMPPDLSRLANADPIYREYLAGRFGRR